MISLLYEIYMICKIFQLNKSEKKLYWNFFYPLASESEKIVFNFECWKLTEYFWIVELIYFLCFYSRVSVIRGQVITPQGLGIVGIRVSVDKDLRFGFTLTRTGGW